MNSTVFLTTVFMIEAFTVYGQQSAQPAATRLHYPATTKVDQTDDYFGTKVNDPYRWLENDTAANVGAWKE